MAHSLAKSTMLEDADHDIGVMIGEVTVHGERARRVVVGPHADFGHLPGVEDDMSAERVSELEATRAFVENGVDVAAEERVCVGRKERHLEWPIEGVVRG